MSKIQSVDPCLYIKSVKQPNGKINLCLHVNDILLFSNEIAMLSEEKIFLGGRFDAEDLGEVNYVLGMLVKRDRKLRTLTISQPKYSEGIVKRFNMEHCKPVSTPMEQGCQFHNLPEQENPVKFENIKRL